MANQKITFLDYNLDAVDDCDKPRAIFYQFKEHNEIIKLIEKFPSLIDDLRAKEKSYERFLFICDSYQEQPHLIDPYLCEIFDGLIKIVKNTKNDELIHEAFKYMHCVTKMRGYKKIVQHLPHEVNDLEPLLELLSRQNSKDFANWQTRYMIFIWLSIVCMVPFDLSRFDSNDLYDINQKIMNRLLNACIPYLFVSDKSQDVAAYVLAKFMSRLDVSRTVLPEFYDQLLSFISDAKKNGENFKLLGSLKCIAGIFKYGKREDVIRFSIPTLNHLIKNELTTCDTAIIRKFFIKITQRIGLTFFKEKIAKWRYQRGSRVLAQSIVNKNPIQAFVAEENNDNADEDDEEEVPAEIEDIIEQLMLGLKDRDTIVRWSAAKGVGRITNRLSRDMAEDILNSILELFQFMEDDSAWHGGCLAIAELGRRGLLLPQQLNQVVPIILKALVFDKKLGNYSLGRNVRDAACYVCWAFARAFEPHIIKPYVNEISGTLLIVTIFDREVNCRRAASAAFQENVGRQGQFPHGIDIITKADYFAVGNQTNCYLNLSVFIANFSEYTELLIEHLLEYKFNHWDIEIRELTSKALHNLTSCCPKYMSTKILTKLLKLCLHFDLNTRHGAVLATSEIIHAICDHIYSDEEIKQMKSEYFNNELTNSLTNLINQFQEQNYLRGLGGEIMRPALSLFIKKLSVSNVFDSVDDRFMETCGKFLNECFEFYKEDVQLAAVDALPYFCRFYNINANNDEELNSKQEALIQGFIRNLNTTKENVRCGYILAIGSIPKFFFTKDKTRFSFLIETLIEMSLIKKNIVEWVKSRSDAIKSIMKLFKLVEVESDLELLGINNDLLLKVYNCFFNGLNDYTTDSKGDSGSKVREGSIEALESFTLFCSKYSKSMLEMELLNKLFAGIMRQTIERIDRTRGKAGCALRNLLFNKDIPVGNLSYSEKLLKIFKPLMYSRSLEMDWNLPSNTFPLVSKAIVIECLQTELLLGFIFSVGALTESVVKAATKSLIKEFQDLYSNDKILFKCLIKNLLTITKDNIKNERLSSSLVKTFDLIIQKSMLHDKEFIEEGIPAEFLNIFIENSKNSGDIQKLLAYIDLFCDMLQFYDRIRERSMIQLMIMLCHTYPRIRKATAGRLYETILNYADLIPLEENYDETVLLLTETDWDQHLDIIRPIRNRICDLTNTPKPVMKAKKQTPEASSKVA